MAVWQMGRSLISPLILIALRRCQSITCSVPETAVRVLLTPSALANLMARGEEERDGQGIAVVHDGRFRRNLAAPPCAPSD